MSGPAVRTLVLLAWLAGWANPRLAPATEPLFSQSELITPAAEEAAARGIDYLVEHQRDEGHFAVSRSGGNVAIVAFAGMALLASGSTPGRGPHGEAVDRCVDYLLANIDQQGIILAPVATTSQTMYEHGFAALFLCECYGMAQRPELRDRLGDAIQVIVNAQNEEGGWRYWPEPRSADVSVTVCQVMTLRAARNAGIAVPAETIDRAVAYVKQCQNDDGGFRYMLSAGDKTSAFPRSAAGVVALYNAGIYEGQEIDRGLEYVAQFQPGEKGADGVPYYFYGHYYAVQAMWHAGGDRWQQWYPAIRDELVERQQADGSWQDGIGREYATALACMVLLTPNNYLPILQR